MSIRETVLEAVRREFRGDDQLVEPEKSLADLGLDDLDRIEIVMNLEETLGIEISDAELSSIDTVQDIIDVCERPS